MKKLLTIVLSALTFAVSNVNAYNTGKMLTTYDLAAMEVRGNVKKIVWKQGGYVARFDKNGNLTRYTDETGEYMLNHNDDGCLTAYACGAGTVEYSINPETNLLVCFSGGEGSSSWINNYEYDKLGNLITIEYNFEDLADNNKETSKKQVKVLESDSYGNWTKRRIGNDITERTITYYNNGDEQENEFLPFSNSYTFKGIIGGDKNCKLIVAREGSYTVAAGQRFLSVETYNPATGDLVLMAFMKSSGNMIGRFNGVYKNGIYKGVFKNVKGGKVDFNLKLQDIY